MGLQSLRQWRLDATFAERECPGVQPQSSGKTRHPIGTFRTVSTVPNDGQPSVSEVSSDLMFTSGDEGELQKTEASIALADHIAGLTVQLSSSSVIKEIVRERTGFAFR